MSVISIQEISVLDNPAPFGSPFRFAITFECISELKEDIEWKLTYVGSATSEEYDQILETVMVGPVPVGINRFIFETDPPNATAIPSTEDLDVTVVVLSCSYRNQEFVRVGYYVHNEYADEELRLAPPAQVEWSRVVRSVLAEKPKVTRYPIAWDSDVPVPTSSAPPNSMSMMSM